MCASLMWDCVCSGQVNLSGDQPLSISDLDDLSIFAVSVAFTTNLGLVV